MKKQLKEELIALAEKVIQTRQEEQSSSRELKKLAQQLYEKLTLLQFTETAIFAAESISEPEESPEESLPAQALPEPEKISEEAPVIQAVPDPGDENFDFADDDHDEYAPDGTQYNPEEGLMEPNTEKIKDIVAQMPPESQKVDEMLEYILPRQYMKNEMEDIGGVHYDQLPQFEPLHHRPPQPPKKSVNEPEKPRKEPFRSESHSPAQNRAGEKSRPTFQDQQEKIRFQDTEKPRSLNDRLKKGIQIGINDRIAFVRHLFEGSTTDYNRVLSQLNTLKSREEAVDFVQNMVKPDYNNWEGKEEYEHRFLHIVENRFD